MYATKASKTILHTAHTHTYTFRANCLSVILFDSIFLCFRYLSTLATVHVSNGEFSKQVHFSLASQTLCCYSHFHISSFAIHQNHKLRECQHTYYHQSYAIEMGDIQTLIQLLKKLLALHSVFNCDFLHTHCILFSNQSAFL